MLGQEILSGSPYFQPKSSSMLLEQKIWVWMPWREQSVMTGECDCCFRCEDSNATIQRTLKIKETLEFPYHGTKEMNLTRNHEIVGLIPGLAQWVKDLGNPWAGVVCRHSSDLTLLWLWCRLAALAQIGPLAWEPPLPRVHPSKDKTKQNQTLTEWKWNATFKSWLIF